MNEKTKPSAVQLAYADILSKVTLLGMVFLGLGLFIYVFELRPSMVSAATVSEHWHMRASEYTQHLQTPNGWDWIEHIFYSDILSYASIIFLSMGTIGCLIVTTFAFFKEKDRIYTAISIAQVLILLLAASGIVGGGH